MVAHATRLGRSYPYPPTSSPLTRFTRFTPFIHDPKQALLVSAPAKLAEAISDQVARVFVRRRPHFVGVAARGLH